MEVHIPIHFQCCPALQERMATPVLLHPELQTSRPRELHAAEEGRTGMTACLTATQVSWASASDWHRAAMLSTLISGRMDFAVGDVQLLTSKGQTDPKPNSCFAPSLNPPLELNPSLRWRCLVLKLLFPCGPDVPPPDQHPGSPFLRGQSLCSCSF